MNWRQSKLTSLISSNITALVNGMYTLLETFDINADFLINGNY